MHKTPETRIAYGRVRCLLHTYYGRALITAGPNEDGSWVITGSYPAYGVDPNDFIIGETYEKVNSVQRLKAWLADHWHDVELGAAAARKRRYALRSEHVKPED